MIGNILNFSVQMLKAKEESGLAIQVQDFVRGLMHEYYDPVVHEIVYFMSPSGRTFFAAVHYGYEGKQ